MRTTSLKFTFAFLALCASTVSCKPAPVAESTTPVEVKAEEALPTHAEVGVFIMATCKHCARAMKVLLPLREELKGAMALSLAYVGAVNENGAPDMDPGSQEVISASIQVCAGLESDSDKWMDFMGCVYRDDKWKNLPKNWRGCATEAGIDVGDVAECIDENKGQEQLAMSIALAATSGINAAPTIFIDGKQYIGRIDRESLLTHICHVAGDDRTRPAMCDDVPEPNKVEAVLLKDDRCEDEEDCDPERYVVILEALIPTMDLKVLDYGDEEGKALYDRIVGQSGHRTLPVMVFSKKFEEGGSIHSILGDDLLDFEAGAILPLGLSFDPTKEICDNGADDDGNGQADCEDQACGGSMTCREEEMGRLDLFVMSQCPYGAMIMPAADHFIRHMRKNGSSLKLRLQFIGGVVDDKLMSMHGQAEVDEDLRMVCVQDLYPKDHAFMEYVLCRAKDFEFGEWKECVPKTMKAKKIERCATGQRGDELLRASFALSDAVGIMGSPSWMLNNRFEMSARTPKGILQAYCDRNEDKGCEEEIKPLLIDSAFEPPKSKCGD